ncbi:ras gtpase-activating protein [Anaeramoeba flamelloides]|uniref:Ras gtpase-activating protein n=1 Tax=Anaeramoeba flamelloides TaxID=1746091 RepID=A0AAV7ZAH8_9EUKA|nr:ras gtpase-activating protein [Anaeramoeba flamelloides]
MSSLPQDIRELVIFLIHTENSRVLRQSLNEDLLQVDELEIIKRWVNFQFSKAGTQQRISNFTSDLWDSFLIVNLLSHLFPKLDLRAVSSENNPQVRAFKLIQILSQTSLSAYLPSPMDITQGNGIVLIRFFATLATQNPNLTDQNETIYNPPKSNFYGNNMNDFSQKAPLSSGSTNKHQTTDNVLPKIKTPQMYSGNLTNEINPKEYDQQNFLKDEISILNLNQNNFFSINNSKYSEFGEEWKSANLINEEHHQLPYQKNPQQEEYNQFYRPNQYYNENKLNQEKNSISNENHQNLYYKQYQQQYQNYEEPQFQTPFNEQYQNQYQEYQPSLKNNHFNSNENQKLKEEQFFINQQNRLLAQNQKNNNKHKYQMGIRAQEQQRGDNYSHYQNQDYYRFNKNESQTDQKHESNQKYKNVNKYQQNLNPYKNEKQNEFNKENQFQPKLNHIQYPQQYVNQNQNVNNNQRQILNRFNNENNFPREELNKNETQNIYQLNKENQFQPNSNPKQNQKQNLNQNQNVNDNQRKNLNRSNNVDILYNERLNQVKHPKQKENQNEINRIHKYNQNFNHENQFQQKLNQIKNERQNELYKENQFHENLNPYKNEKQNEFSKENQFQPELNQIQYPKQDLNQNQYVNDNQRQKLNRSNSEDTLYNERLNQVKYPKQKENQNQINRIHEYNQNFNHENQFQQKLNRVKNERQNELYKENQFHENLNPYKNEKQNEFSKENQFQPRLNQRLNLIQNKNGNQYGNDNQRQILNRFDNVNNSSNSHYRNQTSYSKQKEDQNKIDQKHKFNQNLQQVNQFQQNLNRFKNETQNINHFNKENQIQPKLNQIQDPKQNVNQNQNVNDNQIQILSRFNNENNFPREELNKNETQNIYQLNKENQFQPNSNPKQNQKQNLNLNKNVNDNQRQNLNRSNNEDNFSNNRLNQVKYPKQKEDQNKIDQKHKSNKNIQQINQFQQNLNRFKNETQNHFNEENQIQPKLNPRQDPNQNKIETQRNSYNQRYNYNQYIKHENNFSKNSNGNRIENNQNGNYNNKQYQQQYRKHEEGQFRKQINNHQYYEQNFNQIQNQKLNYNPNHNNYSKYDYNNSGSDNNNNNNYNNHNNNDHYIYNNHNYDNHIHNTLYNHKNNNNHSLNLNQNKKKHKGEVDQKEFELDEIEIKKFEELLDENEQIMELIEESEETIDELKKLLESELIEYSDLQQKSTTKTAYKMNTHINLSSFSNEIDIIADLFTLIQEKIIDLSKILPNSFNIESHLLLKGVLQMLRNGISNIHMSPKKSEEILLESLLEILNQNNITSVNESMAHSFKFKILGVGPLDLQGVMDSLQFVLEKLRVKNILNYETDNIENSIRALFNSFLFAKCFKIKLSSVIVKDLLLSKDLIHIEESSINSLKDGILDLLNGFVLAFVDFNQLNRGIKGFVKAFNLSSINKKSSERLIETAKRSALGETLRYILIDILTQEENDLVSKALESYSRITFNYKSSEIIYLRGTQSMESILCLSDILFLGAAIDPNNCRSSISKIANNLYNLSEYVGFTLPLLKMAISQQIQRTVSAGTLFRANDVTTKMITRYVFVHGSDYMNLILKKPINEFVLLNLDLEVNPQKISNGTTKKTQKIKNGMMHLKFWFNKFCDVIFDSMDRIPLGFRVISNCLKNEIAKKFPDNVISGIGGFFFLRFICPIIVDPARFGLIKGTPNPTIARGLLLITTIIQALSNGISITSPNREYMFPINQDIAQRFQIRRSFLLEMAKNPKSQKKNTLKRSLFETCTKTNFFFIQDVFIPIILKKISQKEAMPKKEFSQMLYNITRSVMGNKRAQGNGNGKENVSSYDFYTQNQLLRINRSQEKISNILKLTSVFEKIIITIEGFYPRLDKEVEAFNRNFDILNNNSQNINYKQDHNINNNLNTSGNSNGSSNGSSRGGNHSIENLDINGVGTNQNKHFKNNESVNQVNTSIPLRI